MTIPERCPAERLYGLPEPVQEYLCGLVDGIAGMDAVEKFCAYELLGGVAEAWALTGAEETQPAALVLALSRQLVGVIGKEATPAHVWEGAA